MGITRRARSGSSPPSSTLKAAEPLVLAAFFAAPRPSVPRSRRSPAPVGANTRSKPSPQGTTCSTNRSPSLAPPPEDTQATPPQSLDPRQKTPPGTRPCDGQRPRYGHGRSKRWPSRHPPPRLTAPPSDMQVISPKTFKTSQRASFAKAGGSVRRCSQTGVADHLVVSPTTCPACAPWR